MKVKLETTVPSFKSLPKNLLDRELLSLPAQCGDIQNSQADKTHKKLKFITTWNMTMNISRKFGYAVGVAGVLVGSLGAIAQPMEASSGIVQMVQQKPTQPKNPNWIKVSTSPDQWVWYIDKNSIQQKGGSRYFWSYGEGSKPDTDSATGKLIYQVVRYASVECKQKSYRIRYEQRLGENSEVIRESNPGDQGSARVAAPGSVGATIVDFVCAK
jgi:hypothetical protein